MPILDPEIETVRVILPRPQVIRLSDTEIAPGNFGGAFINLSDVPNSYAGQSLKIVRVNVGETGLEFTTSSGGVASVFGRTGVVVAVSGDYTVAQVTGAVSTARTINTTAPISGGGDLSADRTLSMHVADTTHDGYLSSTDWNTFNTSASGSYVPTSRTLHIGPTTSDLSANRSFITNVTDDVQTKASIVPNTAPSAGQTLVGNAGGTAYVPQTISGSGATISLASTGVLTLSAIANATLSNSAIAIAGTSTALGGSITLDTILGLSSVGLVKRTASNTLGVITDNSTNWDTAFTDRLKWDGGATGLVAATGRTSLGATTVGGNIFTLPNPSAITFLRVNADNTVDSLSAANFRTAIGAGTGSGDALTSSPLSQFASTTSLQLLGVISDETGTGALVFANTPTLVTPVLGAATATTINGNTFTTGTYTLTGVAGKTLTFNKSLTLEGTDSTTMTFPTTSATIARTDAANTFTGHQTIEGVTSTGATGTGKFVFDGTPTLVTPVLGVATATSLNGNTFTTGTYTLTGVAGKTLTFNKSLTLDGTDSTTMTFPTTSATIARTDAANTFTGHQTIEGVTSTGATGTGKLVFDTSPTLVTPVLGTPSSGTLSSCTAATDSVAGVMSAADHTKLTGLSAATATGVAPAFVGVGIPCVAYKSGVDLKANGTTDIFTVPASRSFVATASVAIPTTVTSGLSVTFVYKIVESGGGLAMTQSSVTGAGAPVTTKQWSTQGIGTSTGPMTICAAANKVQITVTTGFTTSGTVTADVFVFGFYAT